MARYGIQHHWKNLSKVREINKACKSRGHTPGQAQILAEHKNQLIILRTAKSLEGIKNARTTLDVKERLISQLSGLMETRLTFHEAKIELQKRITDIVNRELSELLNINFERTQ